MAVTTISAGRSRAQRSLADVPSGCALLDAPMSSACGALGALGAAGVTRCPMLHVGDRVIFLVRAELDFVVEAARTSVGEARPLTYWPSARMATGDGSGWPGEAPVWIIPPERTEDGLPEVATVLDAITAAADPVRPAADALTWRLSSEQFHRHAADAGTCSACEIGAQCACVDLAINGLHAALGHPNVETDYWRGLTRIRRSQPTSTEVFPRNVLVEP
jgi:hypothetical protein